MVDFGTACQLEASWALVISTAMTILSCCRVNALSEPAHEACIPVTATCVFYASIVLQGPRVLRA